MASRAQERAHDEVAIMAPAVKYMQRFYGVGTPEHEIPLEYRRTDFRIASETYVIEPIGTHMANGYEFPRQRSPRKSATQDLTLLGRLAASVGLDTIGVEQAEKDCRPYQVQSREGRTASYTACRFAKFEGLFGVSLPVVTGDTAKVEVWVWVNYPGRSNSPEAILEELWEMTLVRDAGVWHVVSRRYANAWRS